MSDYPHSVTILWGEAPEPEDKPKTYSFRTKEERDAFMSGVEETIGWMDYTEIEDGQEEQDQ